MGLTLIEKILAVHSNHEEVRPGQIIDIDIDARAARDFGGANVANNIRKFNLDIDDPSKTFFTFDCNPTGSDQKYAINQHICRLFARQHGIKVYDIDSGIGTHILIEEGLVCPGSTAVSTDSHANILGAVGAFGQGMGDQDIAAAWNKGKVWFKVPLSVKINLTGKLPGIVGAKDVILNLLEKFGASTLLGYSIELYGNCVNEMTLDERITISSMATEMGAIIILFPPSDAVIDYCTSRAKKPFTPVFADPEANYEKNIEVDVSEFRPMVSKPGQPHDTVAVDEVRGVKIDSAFIGSCTNGRMEDMYKAAEVLKGRKIAPGVVLKIVPATDSVWRQCLDEGILGIFKEAGALVSNAGCAGCAAGQVGQNGPGEITISTGNRNFPGKQGKGSVYLASSEIVAASAVAGYITTPGEIPAIPAIFETGEEITETNRAVSAKVAMEKRPDIIEGKVWLTRKDNIDTDMIFHNRYLSVTDIDEMGQYTFDNLAGNEDFAKKAEKGDLVVAGKNFGSGSSRQQAVDCFKSLGIQAIIAESFGAIYERNAINAAFPIITCHSVEKLDLESGDILVADLRSGKLVNKSKGRSVHATPFSDVQLDIYLRGGLLV